MANNLIQIKRTSVSGRAANTNTLPNPGELALNMADGILYSTNGSFVFEIGANNTNARVTGNLTVNTVIASGTSGLAGQVLTSNGTGSYWANVSTGGFTNGQSISVNNFEITGTVSAGSSNGTSGQVLTSTGTGVQWVAPSLSSFPTGDYGDFTASADAFGVSLLTEYDCNSPGSLQYADLGTI